MYALEIVFTDIRPLNNNEYIIDTFIKSSEELKNRKCVVNIRNIDNRCFQYSTTYSFHKNKIQGNPNRVSSVEPYINDTLNWEDITFRPTKYDYKRFEKNNKSIALFILYYDKDGEIKHLFNSKYIKQRRHWVILLLLENKHYVTVTRLNALLRKINDFICRVYCIHCLKPFSKEKYEQHYESLS